MANNWEHWWTWSCSACEKTFFRERNMCKKVIDSNETYQYSSVVKSGPNTLPARGVKVKWTVKVILQNFKHFIIFRMQIKVILPNIKVSMYYPFFKKETRISCLQGARGEKMKWIIKEILHHYSTLSKASGSPQP